MDTENTPFNHQFADPKTPAQSIKVIGVGGGGNNAVENMYRHGIKDVSFILINTDRQVLDESPVPNKLVIGPGRGAGGRPEKAAKFAEENAEAIADLFDEATDMVFVTAGIGWWYRYRCRPCGGTYGQGTWYTYCGYCHNTVSI